MSQRLLAALALAACVCAERGDERSSVARRLQSRAIAASRSTGGSVDRSLLEKKIVDAPERSTPGAPSVAACPANHRVLVCGDDASGKPPGFSSSYPPWILADDPPALESIEGLFGLSEEYGDGLAVSSDASRCSAFASDDREPVRAQAWCYLNTSLSVAVSGDNWQIGVVESVCPIGCPAVYCTCLSPSAQCDRSGWMVENVTDRCQASVQAKVVEGPSGVKLYSVCDCGHDFVSRARLLL